MYVNYPGNPKWDPIIMYGYIYICLKTFIRAARPSPRGTPGNKTATYLSTAERAASVTVGVEDHTAQSSKVENIK